MTSKNSFSKLVIKKLRSRVWGIAISCLAFFAAFPIYGALYAASTNNNIMTGVYSPDMAAPLYSRCVLGENNVLAMIAVIFVGVFMALNGFSYLFSKSKVDLYHSVPIKRENLFMAEYVAGIIAYIIPYIAFMLLGIIVGAANHAISPFGIGAAMIMIFINLLGFLGAYNTAIIAVMLTGNLPVALLGTTTLFLYGPIAGVLLLAYAERFYITFIAWESSDILYKLSPIFSYCLLTGDMNSIKGICKLPAGSIILYLLFVIISAALCIWLYKMRASETAGKSLAFKKSIPVLSILIVSLAALAGGISFEGIASSGMQIRYGWFIVGSIIVMLLAHCIMQIIVYQDFKALFKNPLCLGTAAAIAAVISVVFIFDLTGYDQFVPAEGKYVSAAYSSYGMQGNIEYFNFDGGVDEYGNRDIWMSSQDYRFQNMNFTDMDVIKKIAQLGIEESVKYHNYEIECDKNGEYAENTEYVNLAVSYTKKNGKKVFRQYYINLPQNMSLYNDLYKSEEYKKGVFKLLTISDDEIKNIKFMDEICNEQVKFTDEQMKKLVMAFREDLLEQDAYSLRDEIPVGYLYKNVTFRDNGYTSMYADARSYVYPSFVRTIALLDEFGVDIDKVRDIDSIDSIDISNYNVSLYDGDDLETYDEVYEDTAENAMAQEKLYGNNTVPTKKYESRGDLEKIMARVYSYDVIGAESVFHETEAVDVLVNYKKSDSTPAMSYSFAYEKGTLPEEIAKDVQYEAQ